MMMMISVMIMMVIIVVMIISVMVLMMIIRVMVLMMIISVMVMKTVIMVMMNIIPRLMWSWQLRLHGKLFLWEGKFFYLIIFSWNVFV